MLLTSYSYTENANEYTLINNNFEIHCVNSAVFGVILVCIFPHSDWIQTRYTQWYYKDFSTFYILKVQNIDCIIIIQRFNKYICYKKPDKFTQN